MNLLLFVLSFFVAVGAGLAGISFSKTYYNYLVTETMENKDIIFKIKAITSEANAQVVYSVVTGGTVVYYPKTNQPVVRLRQKVDDRVAPMRSDNTRRVSVTIKAALQSNSRTSAQATVNLIFLKSSYGDKYTDTVLASIAKLVKSDNIFRPVSKRYETFKRLHRFLMRSPSLTCKSVSLAGVTFLRVINAITKLIIKDFPGITGHHLGVEGILSAEKIDRIEALTNCREKINKPSSCRGKNRFRTIDGTCNNLYNPKFGAAETGFFRLLPAKYFDADGLNDPLGAGDQPRAPDRPNAFRITEDFITEQRKSATNPDQTALMYMQWGQFIDHDMTLAPESEGGDICEDIPCTGGDEDYVDPCFPILPIPERQQCIRLIRSAAVCPDKAWSLKPREQINVNTAYLDASMVYGSSERVERELRDLTNDKGLLRVGPNNLLPLDLNELVAPNDFCRDFGGCFLAGDLRVNEQASLASIHTLFVREHNRIAKELKKLNRNWDGERIYQESRKIVGALVQKITYKDWLPVALGRQGLSTYKGYNRDINPGISNAFATAAYRFGHSTVRPTFDFLNANFDPIVKPIPLVQMFFNNTLIQRKGVEGFLLGAVGNDSQVVDTEVARGLTRQLFQRRLVNDPGLDLAALNVQRGRDHGLPSYEQFRQFCRFPKANSFYDLRNVIKDRKLRDILQILYKTPDNTDLWPAGLAEMSQRGGSLGPTFACIVRDQFERLRDGDRFYYENPGVFDDEQRKSINSDSLSRILCDNVVGIVSIQKDSFRVPRGKSRLSCKDITGLDLRKWQEYRSPCSTNPCQNGGTCREQNSRRFTCDCGTHFNGNRCQFPRNPCKPNPCRNGGRCRSRYLHERYTCRCRRGYTGNNCERRLYRG